MQESFAEVTFETKPDKDQSTTPERTIPFRLSMSLRGQSPFDRGTTCPLFSSPPLFLRLKKSEPMSTNHMNQLRGGCASVPMSPGALCWALSITVFILTTTVPAIKSCMARLLSFVSMVRSSAKNQKPGSAIKSQLALIFSNACPFIIAFGSISPDIMPTISYANNPRLTIRGIPSRNHACQSEMLPSVRKSTTRTFVAIFPTVCP